MKPTHRLTPFEPDYYRRFQSEKLWTLLPAHSIAGKFIASFKEYPPSQRVGPMNLDQVWVVNSA